MEGSVYGAAHGAAPGLDNERLTIRFDEDYMARYGDVIPKPPLENQDGSHRIPAFPQPICANYLRTLQPNGTTARHTFHYVSTIHPGSAGSMNGPAASPTGHRILSTTISGNRGAEHDAYSPYYFPWCRSAFRRHLRYLA